MSSFTEQAAASGLKVDTTLLSAERIAATEDIADLLKIKLGAPVHRIERLRKANGAPMALEQSHLSARRFPGLAKQLRQIGSLYQVLAETWNVRVVRATETIETGPASPRESALLATDTGSPLLILSRHSFDAESKPVEWVRSWYRGDRYTFVARLKLEE
jgi:GntR family transcriptional regulator